VLAQAFHDDVAEVGIVFHNDQLHGGAPTWPGRV
jgi:hypothetical protein